MDAIKPTEIETEQESGRPQWGRILVWVGLLALLGILALGLQRTQKGPVTIGERVTGVTLTTFDGEQFDLGEMQGKVVVLNFWASWCKPCEQEAADLEFAWREYEPSGKVIFLGIDYVDTEPEARAYLEKFDITYPNGPDLRTRISQKFRIQGVPKRISWINKAFCSLCRLVLSPHWRRSKLPLTHYWNSE